ncbi:protein Churchill-like [Clytia hemisphaerica]|uniref:protein Churchill-like n=1 Tax=Clytia hemisphaerica TaxID=252671 RepID=UPI0034D4E813
MCKECVINPFPNRNKTCLESGSYLINFKGCKECGKRELIKISNKQLKEDDEEENITYIHTCDSCAHVIAEHEYTFSVIDEEQEYSMNCLLCGTGEDTVQQFIPKGSER